METTLKNKLLVLAAAALGIAVGGCGESTPAAEEGASAESSGGEHSCGANCDGNCGTNGGCENGCGANGDGNCGARAEGAEAPTAAPAATEPTTDAPPAQE